jgi:hypothetical protein
MIVNFFFFWLVGAVLLAFFDLKASIGAILAYLFLVPYSSFKNALLPIELNYIILLIFGIYLIKELFISKEVFEFELIKIFGIFSFVAFVSCFFAGGLNLSLQMTFLYRFIFYNLLIPIMLWQICKKESDTYYFAKVILVCFILMGVYGIFCYTTELNLYVTVLSVLFRKDDNNAVFAGTERAGLVGRIQSTTFHPMLWSVLLIMVLYTSFIFFKNKKKSILIGFVPLTLFNLFVCGVRSGIIALFAGSLLLFSRTSTKFKLIVFSSLMILLLMGIDTSIFGKYQDYVESIVYLGNSEKNIGGSSLNMRLSQLGGAIDLWEKGGVLFGNGFGWCDNYYGKKGDHPVLFGFESIIFKVIIDSGFIGILIWTWLFYSMYRLNNTYCNSEDEKYKKDYIIINCLIVSYIVFTVVTGIFGLNFFLIFVVLAIKNISFKLKNESVPGVVLKDPLTL